MKEPTGERLKLHLYYYSYAQEADGIREFGIRDEVAFVFKLEDFGSKDMRIRMHDSLDKVIDIMARGIQKQYPELNK